MGRPFYGARPGGGPRGPAVRPRERSPGHRGLAGDPGDAHPRPVPRKSSAMSRRHDLDWVRILAFGLLVLYHVGMYYVSWDWHINSPHAGRALEPLMMLSSPWRLSLLFLVSGVATAFLLARARRWAAPPQAYYEVVEKLPGGYHDGYLAFWARYLAADQGFCRGDDCLIVPTWNHLWFVAYLWAYTVAAWLLLRLAPRAMERAGARLGTLLAAGPTVLLAPALLLALVRVLLVGRFQSTHALVDDWYNHAQYFTVFLLGFLVARSDRVWDAIERVR